jgi:TM2 domain-containing membrane protein YozV
MKKIVLLAVAAVFVVSSCTIEKRLYNSGYHVEWNHSKKHVESDQVAQEESSSETREVASLAVSRTANTDQVVEETAVNNDAVASTVAASEETSVSNELAASTNSTSEKVVAATVKEKQMKASHTKDAKKAEKSKAPAGGKSQLVAALLCFFLGFLGIHRFYLGYTGIGILMLLTGGLCGLLLLIDFIRILVGDLGPNGGSYSDKF